MKIETLADLKTFLDTHDARARIVAPKASNVKTWCVSFSNDASYGSGCDDDLDAAINEAATNFESTLTHGGEPNGYTKPSPVTDERHERSGK